MSNSNIMTILDQDGNWRDAVAGDELSMVTLRVYQVDHSGNPIWSYLTVLPVFAFDLEGSIDAHNKVELAVMLADQPGSQKYEFYVLNEDSEMGEGLSLLESEAA